MAAVVAAATAVTVARHAVYIRERIVLCHGAQATYNNQSTHYY